MSQDPSNEAQPSSHKADQIAHKFFSKFALLVQDARSTAPVLQPRFKLDKWFNIECSETDQFRDHLRLYRSISSYTTSAPPPLRLDVLLSIPELQQQQAVVFQDADGSRVRVAPNPRYVLLESWTLTFLPSPSRPLGDSDATEIALSTVYKHCISVFRSLYTLLRILPAWRLHKRTFRRSRLGVQVLAAGSRQLDGVLDFGTPLSSSSFTVPTSTHTFPPVQHPYGTMTICGTYLSSAEFDVEDVEAVLSSRFLAQEEQTHDSEGSDPTQSVAFTPTLLRHAHRDSLVSSPGSLPLRTNLPQSPSSASRPPSSLINVNVDRFIIPPTRQPSAGGADVPFPSGGSGGSPKLALLRLEESGAPAEGALPSPVRRVSMSPFKGSTLSGSLLSPSPAASLRAAVSPLATAAASGLSFPGRSSIPQTPAQRPPSGLLTGGPSSASRASPPLALSPSRPSPPYTSVLAARPSPPYANVLAQGGAVSSSPGAVATPSSAGYASSFTGRYATIRERATTAPLPVTSSSSGDHDSDLGAFVQAIDARAPLAGPAPGAVLTSQGQVDDALGRMQAQFRAAMEGLERRPGEPVTPPLRPLSPVMGRRRAGSEWEARVTSRSGSGSGPGLGVHWRGATEQQVPARPSPPMWRGGGGGMQEGSPAGSGSGDSADLPIPASRRRDSRAGEDSLSRWRRSETDERRASGSDLVLGRMDF